MQVSGKDCAGAPSGVSPFLSTLLSLTDSQPMALRWTQMSSEQAEPIHARVEQARLQGEVLSPGFDYFLAIGLLVDFLVQLGLGHSPVHYQRRSAGFAALCRR